MDALLFALAMEVVLLQTRILEGTKLARKKQSESKLKKAQRHKLERDRKYFKDVIRRNLVEIVEDYEWPTLQQATEILHKNATYPVKLAMDHDHLGKTRAEIVNNLNAKRLQWAEELRNADKRVAVIRDNMKNDSQNANARLVYVEKWLFARHESLLLKLDSEPRSPAPRVDYEERVHDELVRAFELQIQEREKTLEYWRQRYSKDTNRIGERLIEMCEKLRVAVTRREELQKLFDLHEGEMRAWLTFKRERAARLAREERRNTSARLLQAWWRGIMVRRALGAFKYLKNMKKTPSKSKKK